MKNKLRHIIFSCLYFTGLGWFLKKNNQKKGRVPILLFHRVSDTPDLYWHALTIKEFDKIISFFSKHYLIKSLNDLFDEKANNQSCYIVFDDAFSDFKENALPVLKKFNLPVTMFVPADCVERQNPIWPTQLNLYVDGTNKKNISYSFSGKHHEWSLDGLQNKVKAANEIEFHLKKLPYKLFKKAFNDILLLLEPVKNSAAIKIMSWQDINNTAGIVDYQSHTMTHPMLGNIDSPNDLEFEIGDSKKLIEKRLRTPHYISYPIGSYNQAVLEKAGQFYSAGFAVENRLVERNRLNNNEYMYKIPRFNVSDRSAYELFFRVNGFHKYFFGR